MKTHLNLATSDLPKSVAFYSTLLDAKPSKMLDDYALFITDEPALELALDLRDAVAPAHNAHFGICVESAEQVETAITRLESAGLADSIERGDTCCYAKQTKVWTTDPEGRRWEVYAVHEDTEDRDTDETVCCSITIESERECCPA